MKSYKLKKKKKKKARYFMNDILTQALAEFIKHGWASTTLHFHKLHGVKHIVNLD